MAYRISVIMGIYNCAPTLGDALDSLLAQTCQDFKVIMCDDGSTDNTALIAKEYAYRYPGRFVLVKNEVNMGLNYTLNRCLELADTEYVARMDGDDLSLPERFELELNFLDCHPEYAIVSGPMIYFDEKGDFRTGRISRPEPTDADFVKGTPFCHAPCMVRREAYEAVGGYSVDKKLLRVEDYHLWLKMYLAGYRGYRLNRPIYKMRDNRDAMVRRTLRNRINEVYVKHLCIKELKLSKLQYIHLIVPLLKACCPNRLAMVIRKFSSVS